MNRQEIILVVITLYMVFMLLIGVYYCRKSNNIHDYALGGRNLGPWVTALSAQASDMSGWLLTGLPGLAYLSLAGFKEAAWTAIGLAVGTLLNWLIVGKRLRSYTEIAGNSVTLPDYLENRFRDRSRILRVATAAATVVFFLIYTSSMFVTGAKLFATIFGLEYSTALLISSLIIVSYTFLGGFMAVCMTDFFQGILMFFGVLVVPIVGAMLSGGFGATMQAIDPAAWQLFPTGDGTVTWVLIASSLAWGLGYFGQPHILARFMAIDKPSDIKPATIVAMIWVSISLFAAVMVGAVGRVYLADAPLAEGAHETIFMVLVNNMFPAILAGVLLSAIMAAVMSTADSQLLVTSTVLAEDFYKNLIRKNASDKEVLWISRIGVLVVSVIAVVLAMDPNSSIFGIVSYAWAGLGASFGPAVLVSLYWKRMTRRGAIAGVVVGAVGTVVFNWLKTNVGGIFSIYELLPAFILAVVVIVVVSLLDQAPQQEIQQEFDAAVEFSKK
ncbi:MAG: sodium/proline symporter PutP [Eubacteriales bacterium]|jgi:sodium/proline symporter